MSKHFQESLVEGRAVPTEQSAHLLSLLRRRWTPHWAHWDSFLWAVACILAWGRWMQPISCDTHFKMSQTSDEKFKASKPTFVLPCGPTHLGPKVMVMKGLVFTHWPLSSPKWWLWYPKCSFLAICRHTSFYCTLQITALKKKKERKKQLKVCGNSWTASLWVPFFQEHFLTLHLCIPFDNSPNISHFFLVILSFVMICD